jgi:SAM-dependent methyltransferase
MSQAAPVSAAPNTSIVSAEPADPGRQALRGAQSAFLLAAFGLAIFLNAALLFAVQPMFTKMVLPLLGGSPSVWNTCLLFFQSALLGGYVYAHLTSRIWRPLVQAGVHLTLLLLSLVLLPIHVSRMLARPAGSLLPIPWLLGLLALSLGLPFFLLSAGAPMLQRWFATTRHRSADNPYFLYAASNLGSFTALLAYPFVIEPRLPLSQQSVSWLEFYYVLLALIAACAAAAYFLRRPAVSDTVLSTVVREPDPAEAVALEGHGALPGSVRHLVEEHHSVADRLLPEPDQPITQPTIIPNGAWRLRWVLLSFAPSSLLIGTTTYLSTDIASAPFLWVIPLALYLLTFVLVFARRPPLNRNFMLFLQLVLGLTLMVQICIGPSASLVTQGTLHLFTFFVMAMVCHRELADSRPRPEYLTEFYLWMSLGGVLGGVFNVVVAPLLYNSLVEYPFALIIAFGLRPSPQRSIGSRRDLFLDVLLPALLCAAVWGGFRLPTPPDAWGKYGTQIFLGVAAAIVAFFWHRPLRLALGLGAIYAGVKLADAATSDIILQRRSFFGIYRVREMLEYHVLQNGTTTHGGQSQRPERRKEPLTYYYRTGPLGQLFDNVVNERPHRRVAIVGLGTGTTACYGRAGEHWTYYEIDPLVVRIARSPAFFSYLRDCEPKIDIVLGDARLSLQQAPDSEFDLIILDAFSSDAIPVHLLTREALALYLRKLKEGGAVTFHISNRFLDLRPVLIGLANDARVPGALGDNDVTDAERGKLYYGTRWIVIAKKPATLASLVRQQGWIPLPPAPAGRVWTDDYSDILSVMRWR